MRKIIERKHIKRITAAITTILILTIAVTATIPAYAAGDTTIPTLTAVVNNGMLTVDATDDASGIAAIIINGFEFTELSNGSITIRMQQYDTGYQYFTMQAKDGAGNLSEVYRVNNPYYSFPDEDNGEEAEDPALPEDAKPTKPTNAEGEVTDHVKTDDKGNKTDRRSRSSSSTSSSSSSTKSSSPSTKKTEVDEDDEDDLEVDSASRISAEGREFYTIMTKTGKVFYLVIDRTKDEETVHFLTDISENDLLNATEDNKPTLPQNSAVVIKDAGLADVSAGAGRDGEEKKEEPEIKEDPTETVSADDLMTDEELAAANAEDEDDIEELSPFHIFLKKYGSLAATGIIGLIVIIGYFILKVMKRGSDEDYVEDEEEDDEDEGGSESDDDEEDDPNDDFFARADEDEEDSNSGDDPDAEIDRSMLKPVSQSEQQAGPMEMTQQSQEQPVSQPEQQQQIQPHEMQPIHETDPTQSPSQPSPQPVYQQEAPVYLPQRPENEAVPETKTEDAVYTPGGSSTPENVIYEDVDDEEPEEEEEI